MLEQERALSRDSIETCAQRERCWGSWIQRGLGQKSLWAQMWGDEVQQWVAWRTECCCSVHGLPAWGTGWKQHLWHQGSDTVHETQSLTSIVTAALSLHKSTGSTAASRAVGGEDKEAQEFWFISGSTSFGDNLYGRSIRPPVRTCCGTPTQNTPVRQEVTEVIAHAALGSTSEKNTMQIPLYCYQPADTGTCSHLRIYFIPIQNNLNQLSQSRRLWDT